MMRSPIPKEIRDELSKDSFMKRCILNPLFCKGRIQFHHSFSYAGCRQNEIWAILPLCETHHRQEASYRDAINSALRARIAHFKADDDFRRKYPRSNLLLQPNPVEGV